MTIQIARRLAQALNVKSGSRIKTIDDCMRAYGRAVAQGPTVPMTGSIDASQVISGTFADGLISQSSVTQHEAALNIDWLQLTGVPATFPPSAHNHNASDVNAGTFADARIQQSNVTQHQAALNIDWMQLASVPSTFPPANHITSGTWTPTDNSGGGLVITELATSTWQKHEGLVIARCAIVYPATASGLDASLAGLPFTVANEQPARQAFVSYHTLAGHLMALPSQGTQAVNFHKTLGANATNVDMSGAVVFMTALYYT